MLTEKYFTPSVVTSVGSMPSSVSMNSMTSVGKSVVNSATSSKGVFSSPSLACRRGFFFTFFRETVKGSGFFSGSGSTLDFFFFVILSFLGLSSSTTLTSSVTFWVTSVTSVGSSETWRVISVGKEKGERVRGEFEGAQEQKNGRLCTKGESNRKIIGID